MKLKQAFYLLVIFLFTLPLQGMANTKLTEEHVISYIADPKTQQLAFYWQDDNGQLLRSLGNLKSFVESKNEELVFAMNGGMYNIDGAPTGLFIDNFKMIKGAVTSKGYGNFHLKPNGVFYLTADNKAKVVKTESFVDNGKVKFATQSGPMLLIKGKYHPAFLKNSDSLKIRNGVGILPDGRVIFAMTKVPVNFYQFASYFKAKGCKDALYLDGTVSQTYLPEKTWQQTGGYFGVMIGVTKAIK